jgi:UDP-glucose 4-epimerase
VFNICSGRQTTVVELAETIAELCRTELKIRHRPRRAGEVLHSLGDCSAARRQLGLAAPTELHLGLQLTLEWMDASEPVIREAAEEAEPVRQLQAV